MHTSATFLTIVLGLLLGLCVSLYLQGHRSPYEILPIVNSAGFSSYQEKIRQTDATFTTLFYTDFGTLLKLTDNALVFKGRSGITKYIPITPQMNRIAIFDSRYTETKHVPAAKSQFVPGSKIIVEILFDWNKNTLTNFVVELDKR